MKILAFDISSNHCSISILNEKEAIIGSDFEKMTFGQAEALLPKIADCLKSAKIYIKEIDLIGVSVGPGSFTGIRAGIATARSLAMALNKPAIGVSCLKAYFEQLEEKENKNLVVIETKRADFYYQIFDKDGRELSKARTGFSKDIIKEFDYEYSITGDGKNRFMNEIEIGSDFDDITIKAETIAKIAKKQYLANKEKIDKDMAKYYPRPLYLRAATVRK